MKLYATTTSERASKGQGGNSYLAVDLFVNLREHPLFKVEMKHNKNNGQTIVFFKTLSFGKWIDSYKTIVFENMEKR